MFAHYSLNPHKFVLSMSQMKGAKVPNPRRSSACDCTCCHAHSVLFLPMHSLLKGFRFSHACHAHSVLFLPTESSHEFLTLFHRPCADSTAL